MYIIALLVNKSQMNNKCTPIKKNDTNDLYIFEIIARDIQ